MRINRWPGGNLDIEPGDMVLISSRGPGDSDGVWAEVEVADGEPDRSPSWIPTPSPPAMFLGETAPGTNMTRGAQVLLDGRILNVPGLYLMPI